MTGTTFCGNCPVDPALLSLVHNEVLQLSSSLEDFVCQFKEQYDLLKSQILEVKQNLEELLELPQKFKEMKNDVETLKQQMADLSCSALKRQQSVNPPSFFGALERNEYFTGRKKELESLDNAFQDVTTTKDVLKGCKKGTKVHGICGLGGCGKSSLAFEYAWRNLEHYSGGVYVINGESDELLRSSVQGIHGQFVYKSQPNKHEEAKQFDQLMTETLSRLGSLRHKWLLLVDNMDQKKLSSYTRKMFLGQWKNKTLGDILVTSRRSPQALCEDLDLRPENCLELDAFSVDESIEFLKKRTGLATAFENQEEGVTELAQELGGLPLALEQAAAYISALKCSAQSYLEQYREQKSILLNRKSAKPCSEVYSEARLAVQTTWRLNFSYIENDETDEGLGKAASFFMKIATYLSPDEIPIEILNVGAPEIDHKYLKDRLKMPIGAEQIVDLLLRFSLFRRKSDDSLSIHRLVQETLTADSERELYALIKANDVKSLVMDHCSVNFSNSGGLLVEAHHRQQVIVSVRSTKIQMSRGPGIVIRGGRADSHISICDSQLDNNLQGIVMITPGRFYMENNCISHNLCSGIVAAGGCNGGLLRNLVAVSPRAIVLQRANATIEENVISENFGWGIVCCLGSNLTCKQTSFENNYCGGLRIILNGQGNVLVEKCEFRNNLGPVVFPSEAREICPCELQCGEMFTSPHQESPFMFYLRNFLQLAKTDMLEYADEFKSPLLLENRFPDVPDVLPWEPRERCSGCWKDLHSIGDFIECSSCLVARYCSKQCSDTARDVHSFVCNSIREANKTCQPLRLLSRSPIKADCQRKAGNCLCVITALLIVLAPAESRGSICILTCPLRNLHTVLKSADLYSFVMIHGVPIKESMMDIKAASILANFDPESHTVTVYWHRIFPVDRVQNGWSWVNRSLDLFAKSCSREGAS